MNIISVVGSLICMMILFAFGFFIDYTDGFHRIHLCKACHREFMTEFMEICTPEEYDCAFVV